MSRSELVNPFPPPTATSTVVSYELRCPCGTPHTLFIRHLDTQEKYEKVHPSIFGLGRVWPFSKWSEWNSGGTVTSWTDADTGLKCQALVRGDGKVFGTPKCTRRYAPIDPKCVATARVVDGFLKGYDGMYLW